MDMLKILHNPRCTKSRETLQLIEESGEMVQVVEYLKTVPSEEELADIINMLGIKPEQLLRKGEAIYKEQYKGKNLSDEEWIKAMVEHPKLIERPIVIKGKEAVIGRPPENVKKLIG
ncbi:arsenate reductase (glutaredoxin) [Roseivirga sp.]|uniref:arsenate reductase (glutaredoxin) n=1 Tax=Roseivirga sp. TaxID=1964215 RepID=UPI003B52E2FC